MEQNMPVIAKKTWSLMRAVFYMLRKGIEKGKLMADLNIMLKRGKIAAAGKAFQNLMFHHNHSRSISTLNHRRRDEIIPFEPSPPAGEYEFRFGDTNSTNSLHSFHKKQSNSHSHFFSCAHAPQTDEQENTVSVNAAAVTKAFEMLSEAASPDLPGFGKTPTVRELRVTDSPFSLQAVDEESHVDEAAEEFIMKFYKELKRQNKISLDLSQRLN